MATSSAARDYSARTGYQKSVQYDLSHFEVPEHASQQRRQQQLRVVVTPMSQRLLSSRALVVKVVVGVVLLVMLMTSTLYSRAVLTTINENINVKTEELNTLNGEYARLQTELESKISLKNIEEYATANLGMMKIDQAQIQYLNVDEGDSVTLYNTAGDNSLMAKLQGWLSEIMVIIGLNIK